MTWHLFQASSDDDHECVNDDCGVIVADDALDAYIHPCPAPACAAPSNAGGACVIVSGEGGPSCAYCGDDPEVTEENDESEFYAALDELGDGEDDLSDLELQARADALLDEARP